MDLLAFIFYPPISFIPQSHAWNSARSFLQADQSPSPAITPVSRKGPWTCSPGQICWSVYKKPPCLTNAGINHRWTRLIEQFPVVGKRATAAPVCWLSQISATSGSSHSERRAVDVLCESAYPRDEAPSNEWQVECRIRGKVTFQRGLQERYVNAYAPRQEFDGSDLFPFRDLAKHLQANEKGLELSDEFDMMWAWNDAQLSAGDDGLEAFSQMATVLFFSINTTYAFECLWHLCYTWDDSEISFKFDFTGSSFCFSELGNILSCFDIDKVAEASRSPPAGQWRTSALVSSYWLIAIGWSLTGVRSEVGSHGWTGQSLGAGWSLNREIICSNT